MSAIVTTQSYAVIDQKALQIEAYHRFLAYVDASPKTIETYTRNLKQFFVWLNDNGVTHPTREDILRYRDELRARLKPATVQIYIAVVRIFFDWAEQEKIYPNIARRVKGAKVDKDHKKDYLTPTQIKGIVSGIDRNSVNGLRNYAIFKLMASCGLRTIEVVRANVEDLRPLGEKMVLYVQGKGHAEKSRPVPIPPAVEADIRAYLAFRGKVAEDAPLFCSTSNNGTGKRLSTRTVSGIAKQAMINAGFNSPRLTAHSLRHTAATAALESGQTIEAVREFLRHSNINTTMIYVHTLGMAKNECSNAACEYLFR